MLKEMHNVPYAIHPGYQKKFAAVRSQLFWHRMKNDVSYSIVICMEFQRVKYEHRNPMGLLQPFPISKKKWEVVTIDFITKLSRTTKKHDSIMVVVDKLKKDAHFVPVKLTDTTTNISEVYMRKIARLNGIPKEIVSGRDTKFTSNLWRGLFKVFGTNMNFITTYHSRLYGKT
jgi:hypothetical protein